MVKAPDFEKVRDYILKRLENELSPNLTYHCLEHTVNEVVPVADRLAILEKVSEEDHLLLLTGAYYHDLGFIYQRQGHESISIQQAEQTLPIFGYSDAQVVLIRGIILATSLPQSPTNLLERIMSDSDLDYLSHENFWVRSNDLRHELDNYGTKFSDEDWHIYQLRFMQSHKYLTASERALGDAVKQKHVLEIQKLLDKARKSN